MSKGTMVTAEKHSTSRSILVFGYGNPSCQDDAVGIVLAEELEKQARQHVDYLYDFQLYVEHAEDVARYEKVLFIDASLVCQEPFQMIKIKAAPELSTALSFTSHYFSPEALLALCRDHFNHIPEAWMIGIKIYELELNEPITEQAERNKKLAGEYISLLLDEWELTPASALG